MASFEELEFEWNILFQQYEQWTRKDLQLAAELGKTLLERNKELETALKHHQNIIDDQAQEIEYLQKQTAALREVNDSRLRIYEQLEVGIQDLERANHRLLIENTTDKKQIKTLQVNIENLETKCEELNKNLEETKSALLIEKRKNEKLLQKNINNDDENKLNLNLNRIVVDDEYNKTDDNTESNYAQTTTISQETDKKNISDIPTIESTDKNSIDSSNCANNKTNNLEENEEVIRIVTELETTKKALLCEQQRVTELEEQIVTIIQENQSLQSRAAQFSTNEEMRSIHDELSILDEVRQGTMCSRCLRSVNDKNTGDDNLSVIETEEDDDRSVSGVMNIESSTPPVYCSTVTIQADCVICSKSSKYLHELPISLQSLLLELWLHFQKITLIKWTLKVLQWPALLIYRMISCLPQDDNFSLM